MSEAGGMSISKSFGHFRLGSIAAAYSDRFRSKTKLILRKHTKAPGAVIRSQALVSRLRQLALTISRCCRTLSTSRARRNQAKPHLLQPLIFLESALNGASE